MSKYDSRAIEAYASLVTNDNPLWLPNEGVQLDGYLSSADELYYGGAAGGGKTDLLLGLASTAHNRSLILRRDQRQLVDMIERSRELFSSRGKFNTNTSTWRLNDNRRIEFGGCQYEPDKNHYRGRAHDLKGFDEIPLFLKSQYRFIIAWNRSIRVNQRCRVVSCGNPPTDGEGEWVINYWQPWLDPTYGYPAKPGELRWYITDTDEDKDIEVESHKPFIFKGELRTPRSRTFLPAFLNDNPQLASTGYEAVLDALPEPLRSQLKSGDFLVGRDDNPWQVIPTEWVKAAMRRWTSECELGQTAVGLDVARGGSDKTVLSARFGNWFAPLIKLPGTATPDGSKAAQPLLTALIKGGQGYVDVIGVGASAYDYAREHSNRVHGVNFANKSEATDKSKTLRFVNKRAECYWKFREMLDPKDGDSIALPNDPELLADLVAARWTLRTNGIQVEAKEDIVKRIGHSPDCADAVVLAAISASPRLLLFGNDEDYKD